ncbi:MAG: DinB family protein [Bacteroidota bacterium]
MDLKEDLIAGLESTRRQYLHLVETVPEEFYGRPSTNPAWTIGDVLYHITLGPRAIRAEIWMIRNAGWLFSAFLSDRTSGIFNRGNALFARHPKRVRPDRLVQSYDRGHTGLLNSLRSMQDADFSKSIQYPEAFVMELAGKVTVERLVRYVTIHFEIHAGQIRSRLE